MEVERRKTVFAQAGSVVSHTNAGSPRSSTFGGGDAVQHRKRLDEQQEHHKMLLQKRLHEKKHGPVQKASPNPLDDPDHPNNVRKREQERQRQEKIAQKRLELKQRENRRKAQMRAQQRREHKHAEESATVIVRDGQIHQTRELTKEERIAKLKARAERERKQRRETLEANYNPFDPNSKHVRTPSGDIWDDEDADAMLASATFLHELNQRNKLSPTNRHSATNSSGGAGDDDMYSFNSDPSLGSFRDLLADVEGGTAKKTETKESQRHKTVTEKSETKQADRMGVLQRPTSKEDLFATEDELADLIASDKEAKGDSSDGAATTSADESEKSAIMRQKSINIELDSLLDDIM